MMSDRTSEANALKIAEAYYMVARDLEQNAHQQLDIARRLNTYADWLCERNQQTDDDVRTT